MGPPSVGETLPKFWWNLYKKNYLKISNVSWKKDVGIQGCYNWVLLPLGHLQPRVLAFQRDQPLLKRSPRTPDIVKTLRKGRNATSADSYGWIVTVQCLDSNNFNV